MKIHIKNGRVIDPANGIDPQGRSLCCRNGRILAIDKAPQGYCEAEGIVDASGMHPSAPASSIFPRGCASLATNTGRRSNRKWPRPRPAASPAWPAARHRSAAR